MSGEEDNHLVGGEGNAAAWEGDPNGAQDLTAYAAQVESAGHLQDAEDIRTLQKLVGLATANKTSISGQITAFEALGRKFLSAVKEGKSRNTQKSLYVSYRSGVAVAEEYLAELSSTNAGQPGSAK